MEKGSFVERVRRALGREDGSRPDYLPLKQRQQDLEQKVTTILARVEARRGELVGRFLEMAQKMGWRTTRVETPQAATRHVAELAKRLGARRVVRSEQPVFDGMGLDQALEEAGARVRVMAEGHGTREERRQAAIDADLGITGVDYGVAETGSCVLIPRRGLSRLVSLLPPVHVAVVEAQQVVESIDDVLALRRLEFFRQGKVMDPYLNFITGPSRTGDIEQTIVIGAHGPKAVHLVLIG